MSERNVWHGATVLIDRGCVVVVMPPEFKAHRFVYEGMPQPKKPGEQVDPERDWREWRRRTRQYRANGQCVLVVAPHKKGGNDYTHNHVSASFVKKGDGFMRSYSRMNCHLIHWVPEERLISRQRVVRVRKGVVR